MKKVEDYFHTDANWQTSEQLPGKNGEFKGESQLDCCGTC